MSVRYVDKIPNNNIFNTLLTEYFVTPPLGTNVGYNNMTGENTIPKFNKDPPSNPLVNWYGPIWYWDTSLVTDMSEAFKSIQYRGLFSVGTLAPSNGNGYGLLWNTSHVTTMESMFEDFDAPGLNTPGSYTSNSISFLQNVATSSKDSFIPTSVRGPPSLTPYLSPAANKYIEDDYDVWDTSNVTNMKSMFKNCLLKVFTLPYGWSQTIVMNNWNTSSVTTMESMFEGCDAGWGNGTDPQKDCLPWEIIRKNGSNSYYNSWVTYNCTNFNKMFANILLTNVTSPLKQHLLKKYNHKKPIKGGWMIENKNSDLTDMFLNSPKLISLFEIPSGSSGTPEYWQFNYVDPIPNSIKAQIEDYYTTDIYNADQPGAPGSPGFQPNEGINTKPEYNDITNNTYYGQIWDWDTSQVSDFSEAFKSTFSYVYNYYPDYGNAFDTPSNKWYFGTGPNQQADNNLTQINSFNKPIWIDKWDTSNVTDMSGMFVFDEGNRESKKMVFLSSSLETKYVNDNDPNTTGVLYRPPYTAWNTSSVTNMSYTFCAVPYTFISPTNLPNVKKWDTSNVTTMLQMYAINGDIGGTQNKEFGLRSLDLSPKLINDITNTTPYVAWNTSSVVNMEEMFFNSYKYYKQTDALKFNIGKWNTSSVNNMSGMFNANKDFNEDISKWDTSSVTTMKRMFKEATTFDQYISNWDVSGVTTMESMFESASMFNSPLNDWHTSSVTSMKSMFEAAVTFTHPLHRWDVSGVTTMESMFESAFKFKNDIRMWAVATTTSTTNMFSSCPLETNTDPWNLYNGSPPGVTPNPTTYFNRDLTTKFYYPQYSTHDAVNPVTTFLLPNIYLKPRRQPPLLPVVDNYKILDTKTDTRTLKAIVNSDTGLITLTGYDDAYTNESSASITITMETTSGSITSIEKFEVVIYDIPLGINDFPFPIEQKNKRCLGVNQKLAPGLARPTFNFSLGKFNPARFRSSNTKSKFKNVPIIVFKNQI